jgi:hypothetical protein
MKIIYVFICILALLLFIMGSFKIEYFNPGVTPTPPKVVTPTPTPTPPKVVTPTPTPPKVVTPTPTPPKVVTPTPPKVITPTPIPNRKTPRPIVVGQAEKDLINKLTQDNVVALDKITTKIAPQDFLELSAMLEFIVKPNTVWTWAGPAISSIPLTTDIINDLNNMKVTTLENVTEVRGISRVELARLALLGKLVYLNGKWGWNYKTVPTQLVTDLNNSNIKSANDVININTIVPNETIKDMINSRYLLYVDGKWIWNSTMDPINYNKQPKIWENGAIVAIGIILFLILLVVGIRLLSKSD